MRYWGLSLWAVSGGLFLFCLALPSLPFPDLVCLSHNGLTVSPLCRTRLSLWQLLSSMKGVDWWSVSDLAPAFYSLPLFPPPPPHPSFASFFLFFPHPISLFFLSWQRKLRLPRCGTGWPSTRQPCPSRMSSLHQLVLWVSFPKHTGPVHHTRPMHHAL